MDFPDRLLKAKLQRRYKRFLCDAILHDGREVMAHCPNPGSMLSLVEPEAEIWLSPARNPKRKLRYSWELVRARDALVGINTSRANAIVAEALTAKAVEAVSAYESIRREVPYGKASRVDFLLEGASGPPCYLEVKSVTMSRETGLAEFPDSVTARGTKHLQELAAAAESGARAMLFFLLQRGDCSQVGIAGDIDPAYKAALTEALKRGVEVLSYSCSINCQRIMIGKPVDLVGV